MPIKPTLLVVDDYAHTRDMLTDLLSEIYEVLPAADGLEAMHYYSEHRSRIVAVISDVEMPRVNGRQLVEWLQQQGVDVPIILMSGQATQATIEPLLQQGVVKCLSKPFDINDLLTLLKSLTPSNDENSQ
ncbi:MAG: response regulator [Anaerolineae bacterium]|nr:response regulator [Anaerolineae bacterium]